MTRLLPLLELTKRRTRRLRRLELITTIHTTTTGTHSIIRVEIVSWEPCQILRENLGSPRNLESRNLTRKG